MKKKALITGVTGQDAFYLIKLLIKYNYEVHGIIRRASNLNRERLDRLDNYLLSINKKNLLTLHYGDLCDSSSLTKTFLIFGKFLLLMTLLNLLIMMV